jgi:hypothetical protein
MKTITVSFGKNTFCLNPDAVFLKVITLSLHIIIMTTVLTMIIIVIITVVDPDSVGSEPF